MQDQRAKSDIGKAKLHLNPKQISYDIAEVREYGNNKYPGNPHNWRTVELWRIADACQRHLLAFIEDPESLDAESGIAHYKHIACNVAFICEMMQPGFTKEATGKTLADKEKPKDAIIEGDIDPSYFWNIPAGVSFCGQIEMGELCGINLIRK